MYTPEYSITPGTLKNVGTIEYGKAIIDSTTILHNWEKQLETQAKVDFTFGSLQLEGINVSQEAIKKTFDETGEKAGTEIENYAAIFGFVEDISKKSEFDEADLKYLHKTLTKGLIQDTKQGVYRNAHMLGREKPESILACIVELFDWLNSLDAKDAHPVVAAAVARARLETIQPFEKYNSPVADLFIQVMLRALGYSFKNYMCLTNGYVKGRNEYLKQRRNLLSNGNDLTQWIEYFSGSLAMEVATTQEKVKLLAKDTKIAKATGRVRLTPRQEKIVEYLQDYGMLQNKDFPRLFPDISQDSVLRDLKALITRNIVRKAGSTKSSSYELK
jgi:Fic family protein